MIAIWRRTVLSPAAPRPVSSSPSKTTEPEWALTSPAMVLATVVLPDPDSPTSASVSPRARLNDTPDTASTWVFSPASAAASAPRTRYRTLRSRTDKSGVIWQRGGEKVAGRHMSVRHAPLCGLRARARGKCAWTAVGEDAAGRNCDKIGNIAWNSRQAARRFL